MIRNLIAGGASAALCLASMPSALAQEHRFRGFDAQQGTTATINLRIPLDGRTSRRAQPASIGLTLGHGRQQPGAEPDGRSVTRQLGLLDLRFDRAGVQRARMVGLDLRAPLGGRLRMEEGNKKTTGLLFFAFLLMVAAGYIILDGGSEESPSTPPSPPPTVDG